MNIIKFSGYATDPETICLTIKGVDAEKFLQGQFSNDITLIEKNSYQISSFSTNQGKVIALVRIIKQDQSYIIIINKEISKYFIEKLSIYILMSDVQIEVSDNYQIYGICGKAYEDFLSKYQIKEYEVYNAKNGLDLIDNSSKNFNSGMLIFKSSDENVTIKDLIKLPSSDIINFNINKLADTCKGVIRLTMNTTESYIPQVLNLESLNGISYKKGCYTGQEIVARTHYLGKIKKKLYIITHQSKELKENNKIYDINNELMGEILSSTQNVDGFKICLAVIRIDSIEKELFSEDQPLKIAT